MTFLHKLFIFITIFVLFLLSLLDIKNKVAISTNLITGTFLCTKHKYILILIKISHCISSTYIFCPQRAYSSKTRIKTLCCDFSNEQSSMPQRAYSSKTRIKTLCCDFSNEQSSMPQRAYSSKTRIKTQGFTLFIKVYHFLKEHIPVKQGLRRKALRSSLKFITSSKSIFQ